jgi:hypothetical protein
MAGDALRKVKFSNSGRQSREVVPQSLGSVSGGWE